MYNDDTDNLYWEEDFDGSSKNIPSEDGDPYSTQFGFHVSEEDEETDAPTLPVDDDEPLIDDDLKLGVDEKEETEE